jgi:L-amino acid N-acyltransferase YncA
MFVESDLRISITENFGHNAPSIRLFTQLGFAQWAHLPEIADMNGEMKDLLIFGKKVGTAARS